MSEIRTESDALKNKYKGKVLKIDVLCLGAGPQCAAASLVIGRTKLKSLVVEKTDFVAKTFAEKDFYINSTESDSLSMHQFPGGVGGLAQLTSQSYAHSSQLATYIQAQQFASKVPVLLRTEVTAVRQVKQGHRNFLEIITDQGVVIQTKTLLIGTGLGEVGTKVRDSVYESEFMSFHYLHQNSPDQILKYMSTDGLLATIKSNHEKNMGVQMPRDVILIGNGDGSRIAIEGMQATNVQLPKDFHITWVGNNYKTAAEYIESRNGGDRYIPFIAPQYEKSRIHGVPGHVQKVESLANNRVRVTVKDSVTNSLIEVEGDMVVDSTGYTNRNDSLLRDLSSSQQMIDVMGPLKEFSFESTTLARQFLDARGKSLPIYAIGPAAGSLGKETELANLKNKNPVSIFNNVSRTSQFVSQLLGVPSLVVSTGIRIFRPQTESADKIIRDLKAFRGQRPVWPKNGPQSEDKAPK
ncbi:MAG: hypothetical protein IPM97_12545 [Bdellovibrionaceae bacterium]|nr:hypothetical protein [Pseudobdellovibrionaceae bacterium]